MIKIKDRYKKLLAPNLPIISDLCKQYNVKTISKLNYNESNFGPTPKIFNEIKITDSLRYPNLNSPALTKVVSEKYNLSKNCFFWSNGSDAILDSIPPLFTQITKQQNVILPEVTFKRIEQTCIIKDILIKKIPLKKGFLDLDKTIKAIDKKTALIYLVNPNMPTGTYHDQKVVIEFLKKIPEHILVVIDEAYIEYAIGLEKTRLNDKEIIDKFDNVIILHTMSKLYGLAAFRMGYAISRPYIIDVFKKATQYLPITTISQNVTKVALLDDEYYNGVLTMNTNERNYFERELKKLGIEFIKSFTNFIYITWTHKKDNTFLWEYMIKNKGVLIRRIANIGFRISFGTHKENKKIIDGIRDFFDAYGR